MGQNSARADSPHAARRRLLESHGRTEKFPTLVSRKPALKRCAFGQSWPSVVSGLGVILRRWGHVDGLAGDGSLRVGALHIQLQYAPSLRR